MNEKLTDHSTYDDLLDPTNDMAGQTVEAAAVRVEKPAHAVAVETDRQMGIAKADRANRVAAGLPPRVFDLR